MSQAVSTIILQRDEVYGVLLAAGALCALVLYLVNKERK